MTKHEHLQDREVGWQHVVAAWLTALAIVLVLTGILTTLTIIGTPTL